MTPSADQAIELLRRLPSREREKVRQWIEVHNGESAEASIEIKKKQERFHRAMAWIDKSRRNYLGVWVALDGDKVLAFGRDGKSVRAAAAAKTEATPLM